MKCDYCGEEAELVTGAVVYPHRPDLFHKLFYQCTPCQARVGCHPNTKKPLGRIANAQLRKAKSMVHLIFDPLWKKEIGGTMKRKEAYRLLAEEMEITRDECHIGMFDIPRCTHAIEATGRIMEKRS